MATGRILIVDDDTDLIEAMAIVLRGRGYDVSSATNADDAVKRLAEQKADLIILDVMMKVPQEGFALSRKLKKDPAYKQIPILMLTAVKEKTGIDFADAAGDEEWLPVEAFLDKPVKSEVLLAKVQSLLS